MIDNEVILNRYIFKLTKGDALLCFKKIDAPNAINARNKLVRQISMKHKYKGVKATLFRVLDGTFTKHFGSLETKTTQSKIKVK